MYIRTSRATKTGEVLTPEHSIRAKERALLQFELKKIDIKEQRLKVERRLTELDHEEGISA